MFYQLIFLVIIISNFSILLQFSYVSGLLSSRSRFKSPPLVSTPLQMTTTPQSQLSKSTNSPSTIINPGESDYKHFEDEEHHLKLMSLYASSTSFFTFYKHRRSVDFRKKPERRSSCERRISKGRQVAEIEGDIILGGLMNIHIRESGTKCGSLTTLLRMQTLECMLYTIDWVNKQDFLRGITLGAYITDNCEDPDGLEQVKAFIKGSIKTHRSLDGESKTIHSNGIFGLIDTFPFTYYSTAKRVIELMKIFNIPRAHFSLFKYTCKTETIRAAATMEIVLKMKWKAVSIIYEASHMRAYSELERILSDKSICIFEVELMKSLKVDEDSFYDGVVKRLQRTASVRGVIIFASDQEVAGVMRAVRRNNCTGMFSWIVSDKWGTKSLDFDINKDEAEGAIFIQPHISNLVTGFDNYFRNLTVFNNKRNPWFGEFRNQTFNCRKFGINTRPYTINFTHNCLSNAIDSEESKFSEEQLKFISDSVLAFAFALQRMRDDLCGDTRGMCDKMRPFCREMFLDYLQNGAFRDFSGDEVRFSGYGFENIQYDIFHFKQISKDDYKWIQVGEFKHNVLEMNMTNIRFKSNEPKVPMSVCSPLCGISQVIKYSGTKCCGHCFNCTKYQIMFNETTCEDCPMGQLPNTDYTSCENITPQYVKLGNYWAIPVMVISCLGIILTMFVITIYLKHNDTPVIKASSRELNYVLLGGIFLCYLMTFLLVQKPSDIKCGAQNIGICLCFTIIYSAILTKIISIDRIFRSEARKTKEPNYISPKSQLIICGSMILMEVILSVIWLVINPPKAILYYPTKDETHLMCSVSVDATYAVAVAYPMLLEIICTIYAILTREIQEVFSESKLIGFTMYTTCIVWLAFIPLYFVTTDNYEINMFTMSVTASLSATVALFCLFTSKVYIILVHPEQNVWQPLEKQRKHGNKNVHPVISNRLDHTKAPKSSRNVHMDSKPEKPQTLSQRKPPHQRKRCTKSAAQL